MPETTYQVTFEQLRYPNNWMTNPNTRMEDVRDVFYDWLENPEKYEAMLSKNMTVADLSRVTFKDKKPAMIRNFLSNIAMNLLRADSIRIEFAFGPDFKEKQKEAYRKSAEKKFTQEEWDADIIKLREEMQAAREKHAAKVAGVNNPKTLNDFKLSHQLHRGIEHFTDEQLATYDRLNCEEDKERRRTTLAYHATRQSIDLGEGVAFDLIDTKHTQKGHDLFVVQFSEWLPRKIWVQAYERAKEFGGWYSSYDVGEAVPGLQFSTESQRTAYCENVLCGGVQLAEHIAESKKMATMRAAERLAYLSDRMMSQAAVDLDRAREAKANTPRRVRMQETALQRAQERKALAATLLNVAARIESDPDHILAGMRYRTDFETLKALRLRADQLRSGLDWPHYIVNEETAVRLYKECVTKEAKLAAGMLRKRIREAKDKTRIVLNDKIVEQFMNKGVQAWWLFERYTHRSRLARMGFQYAYELRHALRELAKVTATPESEPQWEQMERELVGMNIPGFFPTPDALIRAMCEAVDLTAEDTVLDPSCGKGDILAYVVDHYDVKEVVGVEVNHRLYELCRARGIKQVGFGNTLSEEMVRAYKGVSVILMNPPFEHGQALAHLKHAYDCADPGTRIAAIMPPIKPEQFTAWTWGNAAEITPNPEGSFKSAFRSTGVNTVMLVVTKQL